MKFYELRPKLPTGLQSFADIRSSGNIYVDKTMFVYRIAQVRVRKW